MYAATADAYARRRGEDPRIAAAIRAALGDARTVVNVGAGQGAYEPRDLEVTAVEPEPRMIAARATPAVQGVAEALPFADDAFDAAMAVLTIHHWSDWRAGVLELRRVARGPVVVLMWDSDHTHDLWLLEYLPELDEYDRGLFARPSELLEALGGGSVQTVPISHDCQDGFLGAYWRRPAEYLVPRPNRPSPRSHSWIRRPASAAWRALARDIERRHLGRPARRTCSTVQSSIWAIGSWSDAIIDAMSKTPRSLSGKVAVVTGGARGIGQALARALAREGVVVAIGDLDADAAEAAAAELANGSIGLALDVTDRRGFTAFLDEVEQRLGPLDILVNNAGIMMVTPLDEEDDASITRQLAINLHAVIHGTQEAMRRMRPRGTGHIVNIASLAGRAAAPGLATYCATKHGVIGLSEAVRAELRGTGVEVTVVMPGFAKTELASGVPDLRDGQARHARGDRRADRRRDQVPALRRVGAQAPGGGHLRSAR